jgi:hypothetical protein
VQSGQGCGQPGSGEATGALWRRTRWALVVALCGVGLAAYNWWLAVGLAGGLPSINSLFSEASANGQPHALILQRLDLTAGLALTVALLLARPVGRGITMTVVWASVLVWALSGGISGLFPFACTPTTVAACRHAEIHLQLPAHHYIHMITGVTEFAGGTLAIFLARRVSSLRRLGGLLWIVLVASYPVLGYSFFTSTIGSLAEPSFFCAYSIMAAAVIWQARPARAVAGPTRADAGGGL